MSFPTKFVVAAASSPALESWDGTPSKPKSNISVQRQNLANPKLKKPLLIGEKLAERYKRLGVAMATKKGKEYELMSLHDIALFVGIKPSTFCKVINNNYHDINFITK